MYLLKCFLTGVGIITALVLAVATILGVIGLTIWLLVNFTWYTICGAATLIAIPIGHAFLTETQGSRKRREEDYL